MSTGNLPEAIGDFSDMIFMNAAARGWGSKEVLAWLLGYLEARAPEYVQDHILDHFGEEPVSINPPDMPAPQ